MSSGAQVAERLGLTLAGAALVTGTYRSVLGTRSQLFGSFPYQGPSRTEPTVALTFDDGPNEPHTSAVLDALAERGVPGTFFVVGRCAERHPATVRRIVHESHVLANHSYRHRFVDCLLPERAWADLRQAEVVLQEISGMAPALYRPPWLCRRPATLRMLAAEGLQPVSGTFLHRFEVFQPSAERLAASGARRAAAGAILIGHDGRESRGGFRGHTAAAVGPLVDRLRDRGFSFTTVDQLLGVPAYRKGADR